MNMRDQYLDGYKAGEAYGFGSGMMTGLLTGIFGTMALLIVGYVLWSIW